MSPRVVSVDGQPVRRWRVVRVRRGGSVRRFAARSRRRRWRASIPYVVVALLLATGAAAVWTAYDTRILDVREVTVEGTSVLSADQVREAAGVPIGGALARVDTADVARRVRALAPVLAVDVSRSWPHGVAISIRERTAIAVVAQGKRFLLLDVNGVPFTTVAARPDGLPLIALRSPGPADPATQAALRTLAVLPRALRSQVLSVSAPTSAQVTLELRGGRSVFWGDAEDGQRKATVAAALLARPGTVIDVSAPSVVTEK